MSIILQGSTSGSVTLQEPAVAGTTVIDLPATSGTMVVTGGAQTVQFAAGSASTPSITTTGDTNTGIFFSAADTIDFAEGGTATGQFDSSGNFKFNSGFGSVATAYGCRAWVNFNGTGTVAIRASGNVTSITDNGTGDYTVNFTTAMPDVNYAATFGVKSATGVGTTQVEIPTSGGDPTTSALRINTVFVAGSPANNRTAIDAAIINVAVFR
jgi:hypothetical protein